MSTLNSCSNASVLGVRRCHFSVRCSNKVKFYYAIVGMTLFA